MSFRTALQTSQCSSMSWLRTRAPLGLYRHLSTEPPAQDTQTSSQNTAQNSSQSSSQSSHGAHATTERVSPRSRAAMARMIRVDHSGELGADRIYAGQMAVLGRTAVGPTIQHMWEQEKEHLAAFEALIPARRVRPSLLVPVWGAAGYALGAGSALLGKEAAMACTVAVETVITDHYNSQLRELANMPEYEHSEEVRSLAAAITQFRDEEMEHHDTGLANDAEQAPAYALLSGVVRAGCRAAVWVAERV